MIQNIASKVIKNHVLRAIVLALVLLVGGELLLAWQYRNLEGGRVSEIEQRLQEQEETIEETAAKNALEGFLEARVGEDQRKITRYVTEETMLQQQQGKFELYNVQDYEIKKKEQLTEGIFQFQVFIIRERFSQTEFIEVKKIFEDYYVNSVQLAG